MKVEMITKKNRIIYFITYANSELIGKVLVYEGLVSDNIIYKKKFLSHNCSFVVSKRNLKKDLIRGK